MNSVSGFLQRVQEFFNIAGGISSVRKKNITDGQRQLQDLKDQIDELSQRLRSLETMAGAAAIELHGPGPFRLPLLSLKALVTEVENQLVTVFELPDGREVYSKISYLSAAKLVNGDVHLPLPNVTLTESNSTELEGLTHAFRLPLLSGYKGHFRAEHDIRVMVFLTREGQRVFFPVSAETYKKLLRQFEAALVAYEWP
jgi:hypothetical protein